MAVFLGQCCKSENDVYTFVVIKSLRKKEREREHERLNAARINACHA